MHENDTKFTIITGACGGLGGAFVRLLASRGEPLCLTGRSEERLEELAAKLKAQYPELPVVYHACDLRDSASRLAFFAWSQEEGLAFSRLVYAAGADNQKAFEKYSEETLLMQSRVNFEGAVSFVRGFLDRAVLDGKCELLAIGSVSGIYPMPYFALYSATKRALEQFFSALRTELKGRAKVTCVLPGAIPTRDDVKAYIKTQGLWGRLAALPPEKVAKKSLKAVKKNKRRVVIGFWNKLMNAFTALIPLSLKMKFIAKKWSKTEKGVY